MQRAFAVEATGLRYDVYTGKCATEAVDQSKVAAELPDDYKVDRESHHPFAGD